MSDLEKIVAEMRDKADDTPLLHLPHLIRTWALRLDSLRQVPEGRAFQPGDRVEWQASFGEWLPGKIAGVRDRVTTYDIHLDDGSSAEDFPASRIRKANPAPPTSGEVRRPDADWYRRKIMEGADVEAMAGPAPVFYVCSNPRARHRMGIDPKGHCPECLLRDLGNWSCTPEATPAQAGADDGMARIEGALKAMRGSVEYPMDAALRMSLEHWIANIDIGLSLTRRDIRAQAGAIAWESTTAGYIKYITDDRYQKFGPEIRKWYKPYRCTNCAQAGAVSREVADDVLTRFLALSPSGDHWPPERARALRVEAMRDAINASLKAQSVAELPEPAAYAVRESIGDNLWFFTTKRAEAHDNVGYKDSVEPLFTADQMRAYAELARRGGSDG